MVRCRDAMNRVSTNMARGAMDSCFRRNDKVGEPASNVDENACSTKDDTLLLSFLRKRGPRKVPQATAEDTLWGKKQESTAKPANERITRIALLLRSLPDGNGDLGV
ncbi:MAG: hypothetical protein AAF471_04465 [Myxococcota bacterium]